MSSKNNNKTRHAFLLTLFPDQKKEYSTLKLNGFVLVRQWNGFTDRWEVAIYTEDSFQKRLF